jgi:hypothetical protein
VGAGPILSQLRILALVTRFAARFDSIFRREEGFRFNLRETIHPPLRHQEPPSNPYDIRPYSANRAPGSLFHPHDFLCPALLAVELLSRGKNPSQFKTILFD